MYDIGWFKKMISCPVPSIATSFKRNGDLDFDGISNQIEMHIEAGTHSILLTWGDSLYSILKQDQMNKWMMILEVTIVLLFIIDLVILAAPMLK